MLRDILCDMQNLYSKLSTLRYLVLKHISNDVNLYCDVTLSIATFILQLDLGVNRRAVCSLSNRSNLFDKGRLRVIFGNLLLVLVVAYTTGNPVWGIWRHFGMILVF